MRTPSKWPGRDAPSQHLPEGARRDADAGVAVRVDDVRRGGEHEVDADPGEGGEVRLEGAGVAVEVLAGAELERVDEDRHHHVVGVRVRLADELEVALVERAHGHDHGAAAREDGERRRQLVAGPRDEGDRLFPLRPDAPPPPNAPRPPPSPPALSNGR